MKKIIMTLVLIMVVSTLVGCDTEEGGKVTDNIDKPKVEDSTDADKNKEEEAKKKEEEAKKQEEEKNKVLTAENDEKVKEFLFGNPDLKEFYKNYSSKKIGFTAIVSNVKLIEGKKSRYEAVLQVVDGKNNTSGPFIKVKDFAFIGDNITSGLLMPGDRHFEVIVTPRSYTPTDDIFFVELEKATIKE